MKKLRKVTVFLICVVMLVCLFSTPAFAASKSSSKTINNTLLKSYSATASVTVTSTSVEGTLSYGTAAQNLQISAMIGTTNSSGTESDTRGAATQADLSAYTILYKKAATGQVFTSATTTNVVTTLITSGTIRVSASA